MSTIPARNTASEPDAQRSPLRVAVQAAIGAYTISGRMLDAALAYAAQGYPVFPLTEDKTPIPKRDPDPTGKFPKGIPGTGSFYKATCDELTIRRWWKHREHLIGMPMGPKSGVWTLDVDTDEEHACNGIAAWAKLTAEHGEVETREQRTASEGLHLIFKDDEQGIIGCSRGSLPGGIEVKGKGGYIVVPPSRRKGRAYHVGVDIDPIEAPEWLLKIIKRREYTAPLPDDGFLRPEDKWLQQRSLVASDHELKMLSEAMKFVPNPMNMGWEDWNNIGMALVVATGGSEEGRRLFHMFSAKWPGGYDEHSTEERWTAICGSPPDRIGINYLFKIASLNGWTIKPTTISIAAPSFSEVNAAREKIAETIDRFLHFIEPDVWMEYRRFLEQEYGRGVDYTLVWAMRFSTGGGKTKITIRKIASTKWKVLFVVPRLELADEIEQQFRDLGVSVATFRGRDADDPKNPGQMMCLDPEAVEVALRAHLDVTRTCCKYKQFKCAFFDKCGYQRQKQQQPQVWIAASNILFHQQKALGKPDVVIVDESMWTNALVGINSEEMITLPLAVFDSFEEGLIARQIDLQADDGGVQRRILDDKDNKGDVIDDAILHQAIIKQWKKIDELQKKLGFHPGLTERGRKHLDQRMLSELAITFEKKQICEELRAFLKRRNVETSGRLLLGHHKGQRVIRWRGLKGINSQFKVPTLMLDATLPDRKILKVLHDQVEIVAKVDVALPESVFIRQVLGAPVSDSKLGSKDASKQKANEKHRRAIRRYILQRWIETGRQASLVICQEEYEEWLRGKLPEQIRLAHYNNVAGLDDHRDVRLMFLIGRTQPGPEAPEALAGALSGAMPKPATHRNPLTKFTWYTPELRVITTKDGNGVPVFGDRHPDLLGEEVRWQICERELLQAFGRARAINRDKDHLLNVEMLFNTVTPIMVDEAPDWDDPSLLWETIDEGVVLTSRVDLMKAWPDLWPNVDKAKETVSEPRPALPGFVEVTYQLSGPKMKRRSAWFDLDLIPDPRGWLEARLGPLALYEI